jgi:hypothetical protein
MADPFASEHTAQGYEPPSNTQFSVFLDNRVGKLLELVDVFDGHELKLVGLNVIDSADHAVVRLITSDCSLARSLLRSHHMPYSETDVLVVKLTTGQGLADLCRSLLAAELSIHYAYPLMVNLDAGAAMAFYTDDPASPPWGPTFS